MTKLILLLLAACHAVHAGERRAGSVETSDGVELKGEVWFTNGEVKIYEGEDAAGGRYVKVAQDEILSIVFSTKSASLERPWRFKNAGSDEKEYLEGQYPLIELKSEAKLKSGQILKGHLMSAPVYLRVQNREVPTDYDNKKYFLKYQYKGEVGQAVKDVAYVTAIRFDGAQAQGAREKGGIAGTAALGEKGFGKLEQVAAFGLKRARAYYGKVNAAKGSFEIADLPEDVYDVAILTDSGIFIGLSDPPPPTGEAPEKRPLEKGDREAIAKKVAKFRDFFDTQEVLAVKGDRDAARVLVYQYRKAPMHDQKKDQELHRLDLWNWHLRQTEWVADTSGRANLFRYSEIKDGPKRAVKFAAKLAGVAVGTETKKLELTHADAPSAGGR